jgi:di/tricarboxylate transporter
MHALTESIPHPNRTFRTRVLLLILILVALATLSFVTSAAGAQTASNVPFTITVADSQTGAARTDTNPSRALASVADVSAS